MTNKTVRAMIQVLLSTLLFFSLMLLSGCKKESETVKAGIDIIPSRYEPVTDATRERAQKIMKDLAALYHQLGGTSSEEGFADRFLEVTLSEGLGEREYSAFLEVLERRGEKLLEALFSLSSGEINEELIDDLGSIYFDLTESAGADYCGALLYGLTLIGYDERIEEHLSSGDAVGTVLANKTTEEKRIIEEKIGKKSFSDLFSLIFFLRGFFVDGVLDADAAERFTDAELLVFIKRFDISGINIEKEGWLLLLEYYAKGMMSRETSYLEELIYTAYDNKDSEKLAAVIPKFFELTVSVQKNLTSEDVGFMRRGDGKGLIESVFGHFGEKEWSCFEELCSVSIKKEDYDRRAEALLGEEYINYKAALEGKGCDELRGSVGTESFYNTLEGYIYGISPAFSYLIKK